MNLSLFKTVIYLNCSISNICDSIITLDLIIATFYLNRFFIIVTSNLYFSYLQLIIVTIFQNCALVTHNSDYNFKMHV